MSVRILCNTLEGYNCKCRTLHTIFLLEPRNQPHWRDMSASEQSGQTGRNKQSNGRISQITSVTEHRMCLRRPKNRWEISLNAGPATIQGRIASTLT